MKIEIINSVNEFQEAMSNVVFDAENMISRFKAVNDETYSLNGGVGTLQSAVDNISSRICFEEEKKNAALDVRNRAEDFMELALRVDNQVSNDVVKNKNEFYRVNPWLKPAPPEEEKPWYERAWNWVCGVGEGIVDGATAVWNWTSDTLSHAWDTLCDFYEKYQKIIDTVLVVVGTIAAVALVVGTGGWALVPMLTTVFSVSASTAIAISTAVGVGAIITTIGSAALNIADIWGEFDNPIFNTAQKIFNTTSFIFNASYSVGTLYNFAKGIRVTKYNGIKTITDDSNFSYSYVDGKGNTNAQRLLKGRAPIGRDGKSVEIHHLLQTEDGGFIELTQTNHRLNGNYSRWHTVGRSSTVDHGQAWTKFKMDYWKWRGSTDFKSYDTFTSISSVASDSFSGFHMIKYGSQ